MSKTVLSANIPHTLLTSMTLRLIQVHLPPLI